jgi:hypothetical protein
MPPAIDINIREQVIKQWLEGHTRDKIAADNRIGAGTVTDIVSEWREGIDELEYESIRELSICCRNQKINLGALTSSIRLENHVKKLGANLEQIESFIANIVNSQEPHILIDTANQIAQLSTSIPLDKISDHIKRQQDEIQRIEEEIEKAGVILEEKNMDIQTINVFKKLEEELRKYGLSMESPQKLVSVLHAISDLECDPQKIVKELARIKSVRQTDRRLKVNYKILKSRTTRYQEINHLCEQLISLGIGFAELSAFHSAIFKKIEMDNLPFGEALYTLMDGIDTSGKLIDAKKQLNDTWMQIQMVNLFSVRQTNAINALIKLQSFGVTDEEILNIHEFLNEARFQYQIPF